MSNNKNLFPISDPKQFIEEGGEIITPRFMIGEPRDYRLHMGTGVLTLANGTQVTKPKESFKVIPIAVRAMEGKLFVKKEELDKAEEKRWMEVYFVNEKGHLCLFMFHGFSYDNLSIASKELFYDEKKLTEVIWTIKLESKANKFSQKFCIADFEFEEIPAEDLVTVKSVYENIKDKYYHIYREGTKNEKTLYQENWSDGKTPTKKELEDLEKGKKALIAEFATPEEKKVAKEKEAFPAEAA